jgi:L-Ala-D/L-Glu epimerase
MDILYTDLILELKEPFKSNKGTFTSVHQIAVQLSWKGRVGIGTAVLAKEYGMTAETVREALDKCSHCIQGSSPFEMEKLLYCLETNIPDQPTVIAAIDMAVHDLLGQIAGLPLHQLWGLTGLPISPTSISLGVMNQDKILERAKKLSHWPILKLKMTANNDLDMVGRLREVYQGRIWVDGNGTWDWEEAISVSQTLHQYGVELLEQPIRAGSIELMRTVQRYSPIPIVADEDCVTAEDLLSLRGCVDVVNIKLLKCGGLHRAMEMIRLARSLGFKVMLGCKTESVLGVTAMAQLAGLADYLDLDGHLNIRSDPYMGIQVQDGYITLPRRPGLGVTHVT